MLEYKGLTMSSIQLRRTSIFSWLGWIAISTTVHASETNELLQEHFFQSYGDTSIVNLVVFKNLSSQVISHASVPTQIMAEMQFYSTVGYRHYSVGPELATNALFYMIDAVNNDLPEGFRIGTGEPEHWPQKPYPSWMTVLPVTNYSLLCSGVTNIAYLELVDRISQFFNIRTGVLPNGVLIYGTDGNWVSDYIPSYTIELSVRY